MFLICNGLLGFFNLLTLILSIPTITIAWYLETYGKSSCDCYLKLTVLTIALFLLGMSLLGLFGSWCRITVLLWLYLWTMFLLIVGMVFCTVAGLSMMRKGEEAHHLMHGSTAHEYQIHHFSDWLQSNVLYNENWTLFKSCLIETHTCMNHDLLLVSHVHPQQYMTKHPIQWGCCKPPSHCGFEQTNATFWAVPKSGLASNDHECMRWSNHPNTLCYDCNTCKAGFLAMLLNDFNKLLYFNSCIIVYLLINYTIGCYAFRTNRDADQYSRYRKEMIRKACETKPPV